MRTRGTITVMKNPPYMAGARKSRIAKVFDAIRGTIMSFISKLFKRDKRTGDSKLAYDSV